MHKYTSLLNSVTPKSLSKVKLSVEMINQFKVYALTFVISGFTFIYKSQANNITPSIETQINEVSRWFTGNFDNSTQVAIISAVPLVNLSTCDVKLIGGNQAANTKISIYNSKVLLFYVIVFILLAKGII